MALQTSHRSEASSAPTPTSTSGADPNAQHTSFSPAGSPPLILAFLAIGLFSAAMIVVFGWRRVHFGRAWTLGGIPTTEHSVPLSQIRINKPKLWDLWYSGHASWGEFMGNRKLNSNKQLHWENMAPFTASTVPMDDIPEHRITNNDTPLNQSDAFRPRRSIFQRFLRRSTRRTPSPQPPPQQDRESLKSIESLPTTSTLQVGVIIIMPSARDPIYIKTERKHDYQQVKNRERNEMVDYSIGLYECPWD